MRIFLAQRQRPACVNVTLAKIIKVRTEQQRFWVNFRSDLFGVQNQSWIPSKGRTAKVSRANIHPRVLIVWRASNPSTPGGDEMGHSGRAGRSRRLDEWTSCKHQELHWKTSGVDVTTKYRSGLRRNALALETDVCVKRWVEGHL